MCENCQQSIIVTCRFDGYSPSTLEVAANRHRLRKIDVSRFICLFVVDYTVFTAKIVEIACNDENPKVRKLCEDVLKQYDELTERKPQPPSDQDRPRENN